MTKYITVYLPKGITKEKAFTLADKWIDHLYGCGATDLVTIDYFNCSKRYRLDFIIKTTWLLWNPNELNGYYSPSGVASYMGKRMYNKYYKNRQKGEL